MQRIARCGHCADAACLRRGRWSSLVRSGERRIALDDFFVRSGVTMLQPGELVDGDRAADSGCPHGLRFRTTHAPARPRPGFRDGGRLCRRQRRARGWRSAALGHGRWCSLLTAASRRSRIGSRALTPSPTSMRASPDYRNHDVARACLAGLATARARLELTDGVMQDLAHASTAGSRSFDVEPAPHAARRAARRPWTDGHEGVLPGRRVRRLHGPA